MKLIYDPNFGNWLKKNNYVIIINEKDKKSRNYMKKFANNNVLISLPILSVLDIKKSKLAIPNVYKLKNGRYSVVNKDMKKPANRLNRLYKSYQISKFGSVSLKCNFGRNYSLKTHQKNVPITIYKVHGGPYMGKSSCIMPKQYSQCTRPLKIGKLNFGPNNAGYRKPFLMHKGAGSNTINNATGKNFLPPYNNENIFKIQENKTNHNGWLTNGKLKHLYGGTGVRRIFQPTKLHSYQNNLKEGDTLVINNKGISIKR